MQSSKLCVTAFQTVCLLECSAPRLTFYSAYFDIVVPPALQLTTPAPPSQVLLGQHSPLRRLSCAVSRWKRKRPSIEPQDSDSDVNNAEDVNSATNDSCAGDEQTETGGTACKAARMAAIDTPPAINIPPVIDILPASTNSATLLAGQASLDHPVVVGNLSFTDQVTCTSAVAGPPVLPPTSTHGGYMGTPHTLTGFGAVLSSITAAVVQAPLFHRSIASANATTHTTVTTSLGPPSAAALPPVLIEKRGNSRHHSAGEASSHQPQPTSYITVGNLSNFSTSAMPLAVSHSPSSTPQRPESPGLDAASRPAGIVSSTDLQRAPNHNTTLPSQSTQPAAQLASMSVPDTASLLGWEDSSSWSTPSAFASGRIAELQLTPRGWTAVTGASTALAADSAISHLRQASHATAQAQSSSTLGRHPHNKGWEADSDSDEDNSVMEGVMSAFFASPRVSRR